MVEFQFTPYIIPSIVSITVCFILAYLSWRHWTNKVNQAYTVLMLASAWWAFFYAIQLSLNNLTYKIIATNLQYIGITLVSLSWLLFALYYSGREKWVTPTRMRFLYIHPIVLQIIVWTNELHQSFRYNVQIVTDEAFPRLTAQFGFLFWLHSAYSYALLLAGFWFLLDVARNQDRSLFRGQAIILILAMLIPFVLNFLFLLNITPIDLTSVGFPLFGIVMAWGILRYRFFELKPVAHTRVFNTISDAVFVFNINDQLVELNQAAQTVMSQAPKALLGQKIEQVFVGRLAIVCRYLDQPNDKIEIQINDRYFEQHLSLLSKVDDERQGYIVVLHDITERKLVAIERENLIVELDAYARTVAHDLKTPLTVLTGYTDLMLHLSSELPESFVRRLDVVHKTSRKMTHIVDELLTLATIRNKEDVPKSALDMASIVTESLERLALLRERNDVHIVVADTWPTAIGYAIWIEEVWVNYISNAIKYGGTPPHIILGADTMDGFVRFWVQDNGQGLTEEEQTAVFNSFTRLEKHHSLKGHGLGLSIVHRIIQKLDGSVGLESEVGKGSRFYFELPILKE